MYYSVEIYPQLSEELSEAIAAIRMAYDPSSRLVEPHIVIIFPACNSLDEQTLVSHIEQVLSGLSPFVIRLGGFHKSPDHWLFLTLEEGAEEVKRLHRELYTGYLAKYRKNPDEPGYVLLPHIGLGLFIKQGCTYSWKNPRDSDFDSDRYELALHQAKALPLGSSILVEELHLTAIPEVITEWSSGKRATLPDDVRMVTVREFHLSHPGA